jgi:hypothetical protein
VLTIGVAANCLELVGDRLPLATANQSLSMKEQLTRSAGFIDSAATIERGRLGDECVQ